MTQTSIVHHQTDRGYEDYVSMKKYIKALYGGAAVSEHILRRTQTSPTNATPVEIEEKGGLTISDKASTELAIFLAADTDDAAYDDQTVTIHYITAAGVKTTASIAYNGTTTTEVAGPTDFYCWNLEDYTAATVIVSSVAVEAAQNVYIGTTGMVANAELRLATIAAAATYPVVTTLFGAGDVYGLEETATAGDAGLVCTLEYWTPWGKKKTAAHTLSATTTAIVRLLDTTTGLPCLDFYRRHFYTTTAITGKYVAIGYDADKRVGVVAIDVFYGVIEEAHWASVHSRIFVPGAAYGKMFLGDVKALKTVPAKVAILGLTFTIKGQLEQKHSVTFNGYIPFDIPYAYELEPLTEVTFDLADDGATPTVVEVRYRTIEVIL